MDDLSDEVWEWKFTAGRFEAERDEMRSRCERAEQALADLQRSIASALFGAARNDSRVPVSRIDGAMIDALADGISRNHLPATLLECAAAFLAEEDRRGT